LTAEAGAVGVSIPHTSVPRDAGLSLAPDAVTHLVAASPAAAPVRRLLAEWRRERRGSLELLCTNWIPEVDTVPCTLLACGREADLEQALRVRLAEARVGLRLYLTGSEGFVRRASRLASEASVLADEVCVEVCDAEGFRVWCVHCKTVGEKMRTAVAPCPGCARQLHVYHHFSRRIGAYMGFQVDAEVPARSP
jgi:hypothetical protein